jgi:hypothetical protein
MLGMFAVITCFSRFAVLGQRHQIDFNDPAGHAEGLSRYHRHDAGDIVKNAGSRRRQNPERLRPSAVRPEPSATVPAMNPLPQAPASAFRRSGAPSACGSRRRPRRYGREHAPVDPIHVSGPLDICPGRKTKSYSRLGTTATVRWRCCSRRQSRLHDDRSARRDVVAKRCTPRPGPDNTGRAGHCATDRTRTRAIRAASGAERNLPHATSAVSRTGESREGRPLPW